MVKKYHSVFLIGPMGAGKSSIGRVVAKMLKLEFFDSDQVIESRTGADLAWIYDLEGEDGFRKREQDVIEELTQKQAIVLATGGGVVVTPENRTALAARGTVVYLNTSLEQQYERTKKDTRRPLLQTDNVKQRLIELKEEREPLYRELADFEFETDGLTVQAVATNIVRTLDSD